jgi:flavin-binding protein dodecin
MRREQAKLLPPLWHNRERTSVVEPIPHQARLLGGRSRGGPRKTCRARRSRWLPAEAVRVLSHLFNEPEVKVADEEAPTYRLSEIVGTSTQSVHQAIRNGVARAAQTIRHVDWFEVTQIRGTVTDGGEVDAFQVSMKVGFRVEP